MKLFYTGIILLYNVMARNELKYVNNYCSYFRACVQKDNDDGIAHNDADEDDDDDNDADSDDVETDYEVYDNRRE